MRLTISQSKANTWNTCKARYGYKYDSKLRRRRVSRPLNFGSAVHKVIEDEASGVKDLEASLKEWGSEQIEKNQYFVEEKQMFLETVDEAWTVMKEYHDFWPKNHLRYLKVNDKKAEHHIDWDPPGEDFTITGFIDAYAKSQNGLKWLVEHKSGKMMMSEEDRWRSIQSALYITVGRELGHPEVEGIVWDMVKSKMPAKPQLLKNGTFSLKLIDSVPSVVYKTIQSAGQDPNDYPTLLATAEKTRSNWFQRIFQPVTENVRSHLYGELVGTARDILENGHKEKRMTIGRHCSWCDFEPLCRAKMTGDDVDYVIEREYIIAENFEKTPPVTSKETTVKPKRSRRTRRVKPKNKKS